jgi:outer membrane receptor protein involved in Fe transport
MRFLFCLLLLVSSLTIAAQNIHGSILDQAQEPLIGATVVSDKGMGSATNIGGHYELSLTPGKHLLRFSYLGYQSKELSITLSEGENKALHITLEKSSTMIDAVVVSAGKFEQKAEEITVSVEVLKPQLIEQKNTTEIQTALEQTPGVNITDGQANIRGGSGWSYGAGSRVQVLVDDLPLVSGDAGQAQWNLIPIENIQQVEVIKGASSALYGSSALNGVIHIRTAYPTDKPLTKLNFHHGFYDKPRREELNWWGDEKRYISGFDLLHSRKIKNLDLVAGAFYLADQGFRWREENTYKRFNFSSRYKDQKIDGLSYGVNGNFMLKNTGSSLIWNGYDEAYIPMDSSATRTDGSIAYIDPHVTWVKENSKHQLRSRIMQLDNNNSTDGEDSQQDNSSKSFYGEYQYHQQFPDIALNWTSGIMAEKVMATADLFQGGNERNNLSLYTQIDKKVGERLNLSAGARYEYFRIITEKEYTFSDGSSSKEFSDQKPVFRAGLNYRLAEGTFWRASWGQGYRFPSIAELFIYTQAGGLFIYPNPQLKSESGWSGECAVRQLFSFMNTKGYLDLSAFVMRYEDMLEFNFGQWGLNDPNNQMFGLGFQSLNIGSTKVSGLELSFASESKLSKEWSLQFMGGILYTEPISLNPQELYGDSLLFGSYYSSSSINWEKDKNGEFVMLEADDQQQQQLKYRHRYQAKIDLGINYNNTQLGASIRYLSFMENVDAVFTTFFEGFEVQRARDSLNTGTLIYDLRLSHTIKPLSSTISLVVNNAGNIEYQSRPALLMAPRTFALRWGLSF